MLCPLELSPTEESLWIINKVKKDQLRILLGSRPWHFSPSLGCQKCVAGLSKLLYPSSREVPQKWAALYWHAPILQSCQLSTLPQVPKMPSWTPGYTRSPTSCLPPDLFFASVLAIELLSQTQLNLIWEQGLEAGLSWKLLHLLHTVSVYSIFSQ